MAPAQSPPADEHARLAALITSIARELREIGADAVPLTPQQVKVLLWIHEHPGGTPSQAAAACRVQRPNLSAALRVLEREQLIERHSTVENRRETSLHVTDRAVAQLARLHAAWSTQMHAILGDEPAALPATLDFLDNLDMALRHRARSA